jgi:hypothetical protein
MAGAIAAVLSAILIALLWLRLEEAGGRAGWLWAIVLGLAPALA